MRKVHADDLVVQSRRELIRLLRGLRDGRLLLGLLNDMKEPALDRQIRPTKEMVGLQRETNRLLEQVVSGGKARSQ